jgi:energy-converting hydrogenase Eha subunit E
MSKISAVRLGSARAGSHGGQVRAVGFASVGICLILLSYDDFVA